MYNQFLRNRLRREADRLKEGDCNFIWHPRIPLVEDVHPHKCKRFMGHKASHKCPCGATTRVSLHALP